MSVTKKRGREIRVSVRAAVCDYVDDMINDGVIPDPQIGDGKEEKAIAKNELLFIRRLLKEPPL